MGICEKCGFQTSSAIRGCPRCGGNVISASRVYEKLQQAEKESDGLEECLRNSEIRASELEDLVLKLRLQQKLTIKEKKKVQIIVDDYAATTGQMP